MKELTDALNKKQTLVDKLEHNYHKGRFKDSKPQEHNCEFHSTEVAYEKKRVDWSKFRTETTEWWTFTVHFLRQVYERDLSEANQDVSTALSECNSVVSNLEHSTAHLKLSTEATTSKIEQIEELRQDNSGLNSELALAHSEIKTHLQQMNAIQRAYVLGQIGNTEGSEYLQKEIDQLGFDANIAARIAIERAQEKEEVSCLFDLVIKHGADFDNYLVGEVTLLQMLVQTGNEQLIEKGINSTRDFSNSLMLALSQGDNDSVITILKFHPELANTLILGEMTSLHYAIAYSNSELVSYFVANHKESLKIKNKHGESAFKIALRSGNEAMVGILKENFDIEAELKELDTDIDSGLIEQMSNLGIIDTLSMHLEGLDMGDVGLTGLQDNGVVEVV